MAFISSNTFLTENNVKVESWFPDVSIYKPNLVTKPPAKIGFQGVVEVSSINISGVPISALIDLFPSQVNFPSTIIIDNGGIRPEDASVTIELSANTISIPVDADKTWDLPSATITIMYKPLTEPPSVSLTVASDFSIGFFDNPNASAKLSMNITETKTSDEIDASLMLTFPQGGLKLPSPLNDLVTLGDIGTSIGVCLKPPGCMAGFTADVEFKEGKIQAENFTVVLDMEAEVPVPLYIAFKVKGDGIDQLSLLTMSQVFLPGFDLSIPSFFEDTVTLQNPEFTWCDKSHVPLPDGTFAMPGFSGKGLIQFFRIYSCFGSLDVVYKKSIKGSFEGGPITLAGGIFSIAGDGTGIVEKTGISNTHIPKSQGDWSSRDEKPGVLVEAGGPVLKFDMTTEDLPSLTMNGQANLFSLTEQINADITENGCQFQFKETLLITTTEAFTFGLSGHSLQASGSLGFALSIPINLPGDLGSLTSGNGIQCDLSIDSSEATCHVSIDFMGESISLNSALTLHGELDTENFIEKVCRYISEHSGDFMHYLVSNPQLWFDAMEKGLIKVGILGLKAALEGLQTLGVSAADVAKYVTQLENQFPLLKNASADIWAGTMKLVYPLEQGGIGVVLHVLGNNAADIASTLHDAAIDAKYAAEAFQKIPVSIKEAALAIQSGFPKVSARQIGAILGQAGYATADVKNEFEKLGGDFTSAANNFFHDVNPSHWWPF